MPWSDRARTLRDYMEAHRIRQADVARSMGADTSAVSRWLRAERTPDVDQFEALCRAVNVSADLVLGIESAESDRAIRRAESALTETAKAAEMLQRLLDELRQK